MRFSHYYYTVRYLKVIQIGYQLWYRARKKIRTFYSFSYPSHIQAKGKSLQLIPFIPKYRSLEGESTFTFLNQTLHFTHWDDETNGKLWSYNLNYMDYLLQPDISDINARKWINQFIADIQENKNGLEAYPIALRGINWIKYISTHYPFIRDMEKSRWDASLYAQYLILVDNIEYHLLGNHLVEDAFSLLWGGLYFQDEKVYRKAEKIVYKELEEQILRDGAHFELSPMYHCILLDRLLDCVNATKFNIRFYRQEELISLLEEKAIRMLGWLETIQYRDGTIPLLNDSDYKIAPTPTELFSYAERLGLKWNKTPLSDSGYRKYVTSQLEMIVDIGKIGPDYIPGHAHADTFSYELRIKEEPFIVDTGISTYNKDSRRLYERGTFAHNTVTINSTNSSQVWSGFRVGKRASVSVLHDKSNHIIASHNGFGATIHKREFLFNDQEIILRDELFGKTKEGYGYIIFNQDIEVVSFDNISVKTNKATIYFNHIIQLWTEDCEIAQEYNRLQKTKKICYSFCKQSEYKIIPAIIE
jgi:hypothetical protein